MWNALRAELAYARPFLVGGLGIATGVAAILSVVFFAVGDDGPPAYIMAGLRGLSLMMAPIVVGYIVEVNRAEERRAALLLAGPYTPRHLAILTVLLSAALFGIGSVAAAVVVGLGALMSGSFEVESFHLIAYFGGINFVIMHFRLVAQEAAAARSQGRGRVAAAAWAGILGAVAMLATLTVLAFSKNGVVTWVGIHVGNFVVVLAAMVTSVSMYEARTDFTR